MINPRFGFFECFCGETFQVLIELDPEWNVELQEMQTQFYWDQEATGAAIWAHYSANHPE